MPEFVYRRFNGANAILVRRDQLFFKFNEFFLRISICSNRCENRQSNDVEPEPEPEVLLTVQTIHIENTNDDQKDNVSTTTTANDHSQATQSHDEGQSCFVCNTSSSASFMDLYTTVTTHSKKNIYSFVWKFLGGKPSVRNDMIDANCLKEDVVCIECLEMINEYDAARIVAKQFKKQLCDRLNKTEEDFKGMDSGIAGIATSVIDLCDD